MVNMRLEDELRKGPYAYRIGSLFPNSNRNEDITELNNLREQGRISLLIPEFIEYKKSDE
jgi:hypothetical protein